MSQDRVTAQDGEQATRLAAALDRLEASMSPEETDEAIWTAFLPQAVGICGHEDARIAELRSTRTVTVTSLATDPIHDPGREVLFTSSVLLTVPAAGLDLGQQPSATPLRDAIARAAAEPQRYWFDHPIQIGVSPAADELLYGLRELDAAIDAEPGADRVTCLLSVSVTHDGWASIARDHVEAELARDGGLRHLDVVVLTEEDVHHLIDEDLLPALAVPRGAATDTDDAMLLHVVVGVDARYGRHYSFLTRVGRRRCVIGWRMVRRCVIVVGTGRPKGAGGPRCGDVACAAGVTSG